MIKKTLLMIIQIVLTAAWAALLLGSDSFPSVYIFAAVCGIITIIINNTGGGHRSELTEGESPEKKNRHLPTIIITGLILSGAVLIGNYGLMGQYTDSKVVVLAGFLVLLLGGFCTFANITGAFIRLARRSSSQPRKHRFKMHTVLLGTAAVLTAIYTVIFILGFYPGILSPDSINQIEQTFTGVYSNHHPFWHTMIIQACVRIGMAVWGDINAGICIYSIVQILCMAFAFGYVIMTLYDMDLSYGVIIPCIIYFAVMPYHILYSFTMWKDILFGAAMAVFVTSLLRLLSSTRVSDIILLIISSLGVCLLRSNGQIAFVLTFIVAIFVLGRKHVRILIILAAVLVASVILKYPVLSALHVAQPDTIESLSIPCQQIARVIADGGELTEEQRQLLGQVVDVDRVAETYQWYISDFIKDLVREHGNQDYISEHKMDFIKLYLQIGMEHPSSFIKGWIDATKGYYIGGYDIFNWTVVEANDRGIARQAPVPIVSEGMNAYMDSFNAIWPLQLLISIGLFAWIMVMLLGAGIATRRKEALLAIPCIAMILTLLIATPVYSEFRYVYALFTAMPVVSAAVLARKRT